MSVAQIVDADARKARTRGNSLPWLFEIGARAINRRSGDDEVACPGQAI